MDKQPEEAGKIAGIDLNRTFDDVNTTMEKFLETASVNRVYGAPIEVGEVKIIPSAENLAILGYGVGAGFGSGNFEANEKADKPGEGIGEGGGGGGGGGGKILSRPVAVIIASPEGVRVEPAADRTKVIMAAITAAGFVAGMFLRMSRGPKSF